jgi:S1-C subfamily serine protease
MATSDLPGDWALGKLSLDAQDASSLSSSRPAPAAPPSQLPQEERLSAGMGAPETAEDPRLRTAIAAGVPPANITPPAPSVHPPSSLGLRLLGLVLPFALFVGVVLLVLYAAPVLLVRWRLAEAGAEAEASYLKRRAELKAEAEFADERLKIMDRRTHLISLGFREVVRLVTPKVVSVTSYREVEAAHSNAATQHIFQFDPESGKHYLSLGVGSGLIVRPGLVLTNHHVVKGAERLRVTFASGQSVDVDPSRVAADAVTDLAVLRLPENPPVGLAEDYRNTAEFADSDTQVQRGDLVLAVGSPLGLKHTVTHGVISAKGRLLKTKNVDMVELLQTDAAINPGNSGGPLFDQYGRVIGINVAIASDTGTNQGIGFAIPSNTARRIFNDLVQKGEVERGFIGVRMDKVPPELAKKIGLDRSNEGSSSGGVLIASVLPDCAGANAGLRKGDVIVALNQKPLPVTDPESFFRQRILETPVGTQVTLEVYRNGQRRTVNLEIGRRTPGVR